MDDPKPARVRGTLGRPKAVEPNEMSIILEEDDPVLAAMRELVKERLMEKMEKKRDAK